VSLTRWSGWPRAPIFVAQSAGYWPSRETMLAQGALSAVYLLGALYVFVIRPRRHRVSPVPAAAPAAPPAATTTDASGVAGNGTGKRVGASADADG
jgi:hypothetical protein